MAIDVDAEGTPARESTKGFSVSTTEPPSQIFNQRPDAASNAASRGFAGLFDAIVSNIEEVIHGKHRLAECRQWSRQIERAVNDSISPVAKFRRYFTRLG